MLRSAFPADDPSRSALPVLIFAVAHTVIAVPLTLVVRVLPTPASIRVQTREIGLMHWQDREITLLNLLPRLAPRYPQQGLSPFLLVLHSQQGGYYAIPIQEPPHLCNLPLVSIRLLPESLRHALPLDLANHLAVLTRPGAPLTVFLLDLDRVVRSLLN